MGAFRLTASSREWLALRRAALRAAATRCDASSREWNRRNDELNDLARRSGWDDEKTARVKSANRSLSDAYGATTFFQQEVQRLAADLQAEIAYWRALADADDDPTGLGYSRDDEPPAAPVPPGVDGLSLTGRPRRPNNSPAGYASTEGRTHLPGRPGTEQGAAGLGDAAAPTRAGAR